MPVYGCQKKIAEHAIINPKFLKAIDSISQAFNDHNNIQGIINA
jgi:hypothetical protein